ncbi:MAG: methyltransferase domain-containing protein [Spirochaetales bacterium]|nr:methyltransferase domain-containing protein [Spirochaetales bacterium]
MKQYENYCKISRKRFRNILPRDKSKKIIDIACGGGHFLYFLQQEGYTNTEGIDISPEMINFSRSIGIKNIKQSDLMRFLPKHKKSYDMIIAHDIIEHLTKDEIVRFLELIHTALKSDGKVLIATINNQTLFGSRDRYIDFTHETGFTALSLREILSACGFINIHIFGAKPVVYNLRSCIRAFLWNIVEKILRLYTTIEIGIGWGIKNQKHIFENRIYATARKPFKKK